MEREKTVSGSNRTFVISPLAQAAAAGRHCPARRLRKAVAAGLLAAVLGLAAFGGPGVSPAAAGTPPPISNWVLDSTRTFTPVVDMPGQPQICGGQGIASDGESLWFSWNFGLSRNDPALTRTFAADCLNAIPPALKASGHNHIGDIDVHKGILYAPIEDGPGYLSPWVALYDAATLRFTGRAFELDRDYLTEGVPWVAIDGPRKVAYTAEWNNTNRLNVHRLTDFKLIRTVELDRTVPRIQGAKVFRGSLYIARDNRPEHSVEAIDPETGRVTHLFDRPELGDSEAEGIAFIRARTGTVMSLLELHEGAQLRNFRINGDTTAPVLRKLRVAPRRLRAGRRPATVRPAVVQVKVRASEPATVTARWLRCTGPKRKPCRKTRPAGGPFTRKVSTGLNRFRIKTRAGRTGRKLWSGRWRLRLVPVDEADITGKPVAAAIRVLPPRKTR